MAQFSGKKWEKDVDSMGFTIWKWDKIGFTIWMGWKLVQPPTEKKGLKLVEKPQNKRIMKTWQAKIQYKCNGF